MKQIVEIAVGAFLGNWLIAPLLFRKISFKRGFCVGLIAAIVIISGKAIGVY